jgi:hypothetical protein
LRHKNALHVWELASGKERQTVPGGSGDYWFWMVAAAPDGRTVAATRSDGVVQLWDLHTGKELLNMAAVAGGVSRLAFSPDSRLLATGHRDGSIFIWAVPVAGSPPGPPPDATQLERWWADLAGDDARKAYAAIRGFGASPGPAVQLLGDRLRPVTEGPPDQLRRLVADLDSPEFRRREAATKELTAFGERAGPALRAALKASSSGEQHQRIEQLLRAQDAPAGEALRLVRAVEALELSGTAEARAVLEKLASGVPEARLTREARGALERLARR